MRILFGFVCGLNANHRANSVVRTTSVCAQLCALACGFRLYMCRRSERRFSADYDRTSLVMLLVNGGLTPGTSRKSCPVGGAHAGAVGVLALGCCGQQQAGRASWSGAKLGSVALCQ